MFDGASFECGLPDAENAEVSQKTQKRQLMAGLLETTSVRVRRLLLCAALLSLAFVARAADIYGYIDSKGVAHFAAGKVDSRYRVFFRAGRSFDTANGLSALDAGGQPSSASRALLRLVERAPGYRRSNVALKDAAKLQAIDVELLRALVATESGFDAEAVSPKGALGLMQLMPETAERYGVRADPKQGVEAKLFDPRINIAAGTRHLKNLITSFPGRIDLALAAYNAGEGAVRRAGNAIPDYRETQDYVKTVLQLYAWLKPGAVRTLGPVVRAGNTPGRIRMEIPGRIKAGSPGAPPSLPTLKLRMDTKSAIALD